VKLTPGYVAAAIALCWLVVHYVGRSMGNTPAAEWLAVLARLLCLAAIVVAVRSNGRNVIALTFAAIIFLAVLLWVQFSPQWFSFLKRLLSSWL
jgi:hypothetical protein